MLDRLTLWSIDLAAKRDVRRDEGQALVEYALILSLIAIVCIIALQLIGTNLNTLLNSIANAL